MTESEFNAAVSALRARCRAVVKAGKGQGNDAALTLVKHARSRLTAALRKDAVGYAATANHELDAAFGFTRRAERSVFGATRD